MVSRGGEDDKAGGRSKQKAEKEKRLDGYRGGREGGDGGWDSKEENWVL